MKYTDITAEKPQSRFCNLPVVPERIFEASVDPARASVIRSISKKWVNGTVLNFYFFDKENKDWKGTPKQEQVVRDAFATWKKTDSNFCFFGGFYFIKR